MKLTWRSEPRSLRFDILYSSIDFCDCLLWRQTVELDLSVITQDVQLCNLNGLHCARRNREQCCNWTQGVWRKLETADGQLVRQACVGSMSVPRKIFRHDQARNLSQMAQTRDL